MTLARVVFRKRLKEKSWGHKILLITSVHDSIIVDCPKEYLTDVARLFYEVFASLQQNIKFIWGYNWIVPLECECKVGQTMRKMVKLPLDNCG